MRGAIPPVPLMFPRRGEEVIKNWGKIYIYSITPNCLFIYVLSQLPKACYKVRMSKETNKTNTKQKTKATCVIYQPFNWCNDANREAVRRNTWYLFIQINTEYIY
jgi:hypothetical protein